MKKILPLVLILLSQIVNAQYVSFKFDSMEWKMNGKSIPVVNQKMRVDIRDTSDLIVLGSSGIYIICAKFSLARVATVEGNYYVPGMKFIFKKDQKEGEYSVVTPSILTEANNSTKINSVFTSIKSMKLSEFYFQCAIDGSNLDYKDNVGLAITATDINLNLKLLAIKDSTIIKRQEFRLRCGVGFQSIEIGRFNGEPVILYYKLLHAKTGMESQDIFISSLRYKTSGGKTDSTDFIQNTSFRRKETILMERKGGWGRKIYKCRYRIYYSKKE